VSNAPVRFEPIEYRDVPGGAYLSFVLRRKEQIAASGFPTVGERNLLFGTMRAYLGNVIVTPRAEWISETSPLRFQVKSEFVLVTPHDDLTYFWLAYLRSNHFLSHLPLGHGGTRPRLQPKALAETPVAVPEIHVRRQINNELERLAKSEWLTYFKAALLDVSVADESHDTNANPSNRNYAERT